MNQPLPATPPASACPGLLRIVPARDGGLCRVKLPGGALGAGKARAMAQAARRFGDGAVYLTNRANLQLRGVVPAQEQALIDYLLAAGLGPALAGADDIRNLMLSPMAGLDPGALLDVRPLAAGLLQALELQPRFHGLSPKFCIQIDGGEPLTVLRHHHDLWLSARMLSGKRYLVLGLASDIAQGSPVAAVPAAEGVALVLAILERFLALAGPAPGRMRDLLAVQPASALLDGLPMAIRQGPFPPLQPRPRPVPLGLHPQCQPGQVAVGLAPVLERLPADALDALAGMAQVYGSGRLQLTPWQGLLVTDVPQASARQVQAEASALGLLTDPFAPLAATVACTGAAGCSRGLADTKADARLLASLLGRAVPVHLSGCARSCARATVAPVTLLAVSPGRYDLFYRDPSIPGLGRREGCNLTVQEAAALLAACSRSLLDD